MATERLELLKKLPLIQEPLDENDIVAVGAIKATHAMSFADCCIAGLAKEKNAILIHKDPEFEQVEHEISQHKLPYKTNHGMHRIGRKRRLPPGDAGVIE